MKEKEAAVIFRVRLPTVTTVDETWKKATDAIREAARLELGITKPGRRKVDKQTWLWTDDVKAKVREKKSLYRVFLSDKTAENWQEYQKAKKAAKKAVAVAKATHYSDVNEKLESRDESGHLLTDRKNALKRWRDYFREISTMEFPHPAIPSVGSVHGPVHKITVEETQAALKKMKPFKATGPDDLAADAWKSKLWRRPECWHNSTTIPIWKKKGSHADCSNYRPIRLLSHSMKIFERILDRRIREIVRLSDNQCGFVSGCGTIDAIHAARLLVEKHREKQKPVHIAFLDLEKSFDRVPREVIWYSLRQRNVPEELIEWVRMLYSCPKSRVQAAAGTSMEFPISVGVHQGSALSP
ncbi:unnamed protein product, partial [Heligmosomoides polygyrus]|uniref:Reverse transcriptase domain-containing protein n=1 Tax=Heligmosomoides polygyrus TaxID=6339 RepID=A0A183F1X1_HELPZ